MVSKPFQDVHLPNFPQRVILALLSFFLPPLPIFMLTAPRYTIFSKEFVVSVLLTLFGHVPGVLFSLYFVLIEFPRAHAEAYASGNGHIRINEDEESLLRADSAPPVGDQDQHNKQPAGAERLGISHVQPVSPPEDLPTQEPPKYEDIVAPNDQSRYNDSKRSGDNKVQR